jgi:hypothetical protein
MPLLAPATWLDPTFGGGAFPPSVTARNTDIADRPLRRLGAPPSGLPRSFKVNAAGVSLGDLSDWRRRPQIGWFTWFQDHPTPSNFIEPLLTCRAFVPSSPKNLNAAEFCDRGDRRADSLRRRAAAARARRRRRPVEPDRPRARASATTGTTRSGMCCWTSSGFAEPSLRAPLSSEHDVAAASRG